MKKSKLYCTIDPDVHEKARQNYDNISWNVERLIREDLYCLENMTITKILTHMMYHIDGLLQCYELIQEHYPHGEDIKSKLKNINELGVVDLDCVKNACKKDKECYEDVLEYIRENSIPYLNRLK